MVPWSLGPRYLKVTFKYELDSKEGPSCYGSILTMNEDIWHILYPYFIHNTQCGVSPISVSLLLFYAMCDVSLISICLLLF